MTESDLTEIKRKLRPVKSAESLTSGHSEPNSTEDILGPLHSLGKQPGHNRYPFIIHFLCTVFSLLRLYCCYCYKCFSLLLFCNPYKHKYILLCCNRSVSHDSYFDMLQNSQHNSEGSLLDLSEIQLNFELEESEMRIFSEDESLVSSPRVYKDGVS